MPLQVSPMLIDGVVGSLLEMFRLPLSAPVAVGLHVTVTPSARAGAEAVRAGVAGDPEARARHDRVDRRGRAAGVRDRDADTGRRGVHANAAEVDAAGRRGDVDRRGRSPCP